MTDQERDLFMAILCERPHLDPVSVAKEVLKVQATFRTRKIMASVASINGDMSHGHGNRAPPPFTLTDVDAPIGTVAT